MISVISKVLIDKDIIQIEKRERRYDREGDSQQNIKKIKDNRLFHYS